MPELKKFYVNNYGSAAGQEEKGELVTFDMIRNYAMNPNGKIPLIKILRVVSGFGLKDAKEGVENNCLDGFNRDLYQWGTINPDKTVTYFAQFLGPFPTAEEIKAEEEAKTGKTMLEGCALAYANFRVLGYHNPFAAARDVLNRYEDNHDNTIR